MVGWPAAPPTNQPSFAAFPPRASAAPIFPLASHATTYAADIVDVGIAAIRDHKIGNAIRTIDTWYAANSDAAPIAVEPRGANIERDMYMRASRNDLFTYLTKLDDLQRSIVGINHEAAFVLACMIRGFRLGYGAGGGWGGD